MGGGGYAARLFLLFYFPCSADHERDWPPCKVAFFGLATNTLNVRNDNNNNNNLGTSTVVVYWYDIPKQLSDPAICRLEKRRNNPPGLSPRSTSSRVLRS